MLRISEFSKLSGASIKTLRYYDQLELVKPAFVDQLSGYRYYSEEQLLTIKRIASFKEQGFTLEQIKTFLEERTPLSVIKDQLLDKQHELMQIISLAQRQLAEVSERIDRVEVHHEKKPIHQQVLLRPVEPQLVASIRSRIRRATLCVLLDELAKYVDRHGQRKNPSLMILWHDCEFPGEDDQDEIDVEVAMPLSGEIPGNERVSVRYLPGVDRAAALLHECDPYKSDCSAIHDVLDWVVSNGYTPAGSEPIRETYLSADHEMYGRMRQSEIVVPLAAI
ncbi:MerR family transcriptional regulator [Brevibacillus choshinensis]|uniref:MerR family transcriptional regulator n=1 Tax=Brevibacillus choshinensis TaxID=54911 RepID=A0ABX7FUJ0_BRECH|nr:MerR family transcriptional regulator [Brevibacillus choshinensis]QRG69021.1 MerR family transcriptional regulator [Brevibacillus choshinensis]